MASNINDLMQINRRLFLAMPLAFTVPTVANASDNDLTVWGLISDPLLRKVYRRPMRSIDPSGLAGLNRPSFRLIEEQRQGVEAIISGKLNGDAQSVVLGWLALDVGRSHQLSDGNFGGDSYFHSNSLYLEALARACIIDPANATDERLASLRLGVQALLHPVQKQLLDNLPYAHRNFILAAALGQAGQLFGDTLLQQKAREWAMRGLQVQSEAGLWPEKGGFDASYQMVSVMMASRYYVVASAAIRPSLSAKIQNACKFERQYLKPSGVMDTSTSTRVNGEESFGGKVKKMNYYDAFQGAAYAYHITRSPDALDIAKSIGSANGWA